MSLCHFQISHRSVPRTPRHSQGTEPRWQMPESAGGHCRGHCRRDIAGAKDKASDREIPEEQRRMVSPSVAQGLPLVILKLYPELHLGIPPGRLIDQAEVRS
ncbi:unnamed protein product [Staurois parvus]|uniref:Uncharacterized protein n=1 Tax=Staurois parvus TaxID=386267 RepID=A0ABN9H3F3_9NEOB|nr:unnamed protein product [Staurois parvus]